MTEALHDITRIVMPTPYAVGPVNAYLIDAEPLTLIDEGIVTGATLKWSVKRSNGRAVWLET